MLNHPHGIIWFSEVTLMTMKCGNCGNPARDDSSVFCNKCGARLPVKNVLTCNRCGTTHSDPKSQFCIKCGAPLEVHSPHEPPSPAVRGKTCHGCGFVNADENSLYCKKCGIYIGNTGSDLKKQIDGVRDTVIGIKHHPVNTATKKVTYVSTAEQEPQYHQRNEIKQKSRSGLDRKVAAAGGVILLVIIIIGATIVFGPGILQAGQVNSTVPGSSGLSTLGPSVTATYALSSGTLETKTQAADSPQVGNNPVTGSPAVSDTSLPWPSELSNTPAPVSPAMSDSTPPWLSGNGNSPPPLPIGSNNSGSPWPIETNFSSTPPWLTGTK
jgi:hypothetical protein